MNPEKLPFAIVAGLFALLSALYLPSLLLRKAPGAEIAGCLLGIALGTTVCIGSLHSVFPLGLRKWLEWRSADARKKGMARAKKSGIVRKLKSELARLDAETGNSGQPPSQERANEMAKSIRTSIGRLESHLKKNTKLMKEKYHTFIHLLHDYQYFVYRLEGHADKGTIDEIQAMIESLGDALDNEFYKPD